MKKYAKFPNKSFRCKLPDPICLLVENSSNLVGIPPAKIIAVALEEFFMARGISPTRQYAFMKALEQRAHVKPT